MKRPLTAVIAAAAVALVWAAGARADDAACPADMRLVEHDHWEAIERACLDKRDNKHCFAYKPGTNRLLGKKEHLRFCIDTFEALPPRAKDYVAALEEIVGAPVALLSTGPRREETIVRSGTALDDYLR